MPRPIKKFKLTPAHRRMALCILEDIKKAEPKKVYTLNLFNTGIVIDSKQGRDLLIDLLKGVIDKKT